MFGGSGASDGAQVMERPTSLPFPLPGDRGGASGGGERQEKGLLVVAAFPIFLTAKANSRHGGRPDPLAP
jgi:hypothetical protein